jgi:uncharacterized SAM-binding protein YcdF (DUF218 family)
MQTQEMSRESFAHRWAGASVWIFLAGLLIVLVFCALAFREAGTWLIREDPLTKADVIVVLSGSMPARAEEAARVFQMGFAPEVWVSRPESAASELKDLGVDFTGEDGYNREVLIHEGVPAAAIRIFPEPIVDTEEEVEEILQMMRERNKQRVIIVTSPQHTRRVRALWRDLSDGHLQMIAHAAYQDPFDATGWWKTTRDTNSVARELMGLANAAAGFPVRPRHADVAEKPAVH